MLTSTSTQQYDCNLVGKEATCFGSIIGPGGTALFQQVAGDYQKEIQAVTITAGLEKLDVEAATTSASGTGAVETSTPSTTQTEDAAGSTSSSTAGVPQITQNAIMMGAALVGAGAMLL